MCSAKWWLPPAIRLRVVRFETSRGEAPAKVEIPPVAMLGERIAAGSAERVVDPNSRGGEPGAPKLRASRASISSHARGRHFSTDTDQTATADP